MARKKELTPEEIKDLSDMDYYMYSIRKAFDADKENFIVKSAGWRQELEVWIKIKRAPEGSKIHYYGSKQKILAIGMGNPYAKDNKGELIKTANGSYIQTNYLNLWIREYLTSSTSSTDITSATHSITATECADKVLEVAKTMHRLWATARQELAKALTSFDEEK